MIVRGSIILQSSSASPTGYDPFWECFIDGTKITTGSALNTIPKNNQNLCGPIANLTPGNHQLIINVATLALQRFWFDYVLYAPLPDADLDNKVVQLMPSYSDAFVYGPGWADLNLDVGMKMASQNGATFDFSFEGISLQSLTSGII